MTGRSLRFRPHTSNYNADLYLAEDGECVFLLKVAVWKPAATLDDEFKALEDLARVSGEERRFRVPKPIAVLPGAGAYVMEFLPGAPLARAVHTRSIDPDLVLRAVEGCGAALAAIHRHWSVGSGPMLGEETMRDVVQFWPWRRTTEEETVLSRLRERLDAATCNWSRLYMDFDPVNVLIDRDTVGLVDPPDSWVAGPVHWDLGVFNVGLQRACWRRPWCGGARHRFVERLQEAFFRGYEAETGTALTAMDRALIGLCEMLRLGQLWTWWSRPRRLRFPTRGALRALYTYPLILRAGHDRMRAIGRLLGDQ